MVTVWLLISQTRVTKVTGIYTSKLSAKLALVQLIKIQDWFTNFSKAFEEKFGLGLLGMDNNSLYKILFDSKYADLVDSYLCYSIIPRKVGTLFDFRQWENWDSNNLYQAINNLLIGEVGLIDLGQTGLFLVEK